MARNTKMFDEISATQLERLKHVRVGFQVNLTVEEKSRLIEAATKAGKPLAGFIREAALAAAGYEAEG